MSIEQHIKIIPTHREVARTTPITTTLISDEKLVSLVPHRYDAAKEYKVTLALTTTFLADDCQDSYDMAVKHATRCLKAELYHDISRILIFTRRAVYDQNWEQAMQHLDEIEDICKY